MFAEPHSSSVVYGVGMIKPPLEYLIHTHGLVQLGRARNITTVGNISSLTERQVQNLPIKSPKVVTLRSHSSHLRRTWSPRVSGLKRSRRSLRGSGYSKTTSSPSSLPSQ